MDIFRIKVKKEKAALQSKKSTSSHDDTHQVGGCQWLYTPTQWGNLTGQSGWWRLQSEWCWVALRDKSRIEARDSNQLKTNFNWDTMCAYSPLLELPWTLSRMCCCTSPAALVARQVYFPESSSLASFTWSVLPADSSCGEYRKQQRNLYHSFLNVQKAKRIFYLVKIFFNQGADCSWKRWLSFDTTVSSIWGNLQIKN